MTRCSVVVATALALFAGCSSGPADGAPRPRAVTPAAGYDAVTTEITISGEGFRAEPYQTSGGQPKVDATFRAWLGATELAQVRWVSERELRARVPTGLAPGTYRLEVRDPRGASGSLDGAFTVVSGPAGEPPGPTLTAEILAAPARVNVGQPFEARARLANAGARDALDVRAAIDCAACTPGPEPAPTTVPAGGAVELGRSFTPDQLGTTWLSASARGIDDLDGEVRWATTVVRALSVEHEAALAVAPSGPSRSPPSRFPVEITVRNPLRQPGMAQAAAREVRPRPLHLAIEPAFLGTAEVSCAPDAQEATTVAAGASAAFRWSCASTAAGRLKLSAEVSGTDANDGDPVAATTTFVLELGVDEAAQVAENAFGDATTFSFVFAYDGHVFLGPSGDGRGVVRCSPDGTGCASFAFRFQRDTTEPAFDPRVGATIETARSKNVLCPDLETLGASPHCNLNNPETTPCFCGPDYEMGRGMIGSFRLGADGDEWLVAMGRTKKMGNLNYAYMTRDTASPLEFLYADLRAAIPSSISTENVTAMAELNGRLYLGLQNEGTDPPPLVVLTRTPTFPGLDATSADAFRTTSTGMAESGGASISQVDAIAGFEGRLFVANRRAVLVSMDGCPTDAACRFDDCTPQDPANWSATSIAGYRSNIDVTPADKGVTAIVPWGGRLYLARNTAARIPELWVLAPRRDGAGQFLGCAPDRLDWSRIATNFGDGANTQLTALFASAGHLYVGYDNANGVQLWRTSSVAPSSPSDFTGSRGCTFGASGCAPVGGAGFGVGTNARFFDARAVSPGAGDQVWATVGSGSSAVRVYRIAE